MKRMHFLKKIKYEIIPNIKNNNKSHYFYSTVKRRFGELYQPKTRYEKKKHLEIINEVYFDMTDAMNEKNKLEIEEYKNIDKNISEIILNHTISKKNEVIRNIMKYCIEISCREKKGNHEKSTHTNHNNSNRLNDAIKYPSGINKKHELEEDILNVIKTSIMEYSSQFNSCDIGILLKCFIKIKVDDINLINTLFHYFFKRNMKFSQYGSLYVLNAFAKFNLLPKHENYFKLLTSHILQKLDKFDFKNIPLICNYSSSLYSYDKEYITNFIEQICNFLISNKYIIICEDNNKIFLHTDQIESNNITPNLNNSNSSINQLDQIWSVDSIHYVTNALARVNYLKKNLFVFFKILIEKKVAFFSIDQLVSLTNAFSKFKNAEESNFLSLYLLIADQIINKSYLLKPRHLSVLANSFNNACILHQKLFQIISENSLAQISLFEPKQIIMIIHSYVNIGLGNNILLKSIWNYAILFINEYTIQELSMLLQAYTKSSQYIEHFLNQLSQQISHFFKKTYPFLFDTYDNILYDHQKYINLSIEFKNNQKNISANITDKYIPLSFYLIYNYPNYISFIDTLKNNKTKKNLSDINTLVDEYKRDSSPKTDNLVTDLKQNTEIKNISTFQNSQCTFNSFQTYSETIDNVQINNTNIKDKHINKNNDKTTYSNEIDTIHYFVDIEKAEKYLIKHMSKYINSTLVCSIIYSLIKGNCLLEYQLLISLSKLAIIYLKIFKFSELANVCSALSLAYVRSSEENNKQVELISQFTKKKNGSILEDSHKEDLHTDTTQIYNDQIYNSSKEFLNISKSFFDHVETYLLKKKNTFTDVYSIYKFITSFGELRMNQYSTVSLHLFKLYIMEIKNLSYLPLQKI
ncbi:DNA-directed RNA polymerase beta chain, partial [Plasmodium yoelii yoelii]